MVSGDRGLLRGAGQRLVEHVVRAGGGHLPADPVEDEFGGRVVVDAVLEADALLEGVQGLGLGLRAGDGAAVGLTGGERGGALVVVAPLVGEVAVEVDTVTDGDGVVSVDVPQVLAPLAVGGVAVGEVVAVGVGGDHEPQLGGVDDLLDPLVRLVVVQVVVQQAPGHLRSDPLARVLVGHVQHGRLGAVLGLLRVLGQLDREDVLSLEGLADGDHLGQGGVLLTGAEDLLLDVPGSAVGAVDPVGGGVHTRLRLPRELVLPQLDALLLQGVRLLVGEVDLDRRGALLRRLLAQFVAVLPGGEQQRYLLLRHLGPEDLDLVGVGAVVLGSLGQRRETRATAQQERAGSEDRSRSSSHEPPLRDSPQ